MRNDRKEVLSFFGQRVDPREKEASIVLLSSFVKVWSRKGNASRYAKSRKGVRRIAFNEKKGEKEEERGKRGVSQKTTTTTFHTSIP